MIDTLCLYIKHNLSMDDDDDLWAVSVSTSARVDESEPSSSTVAALATTPENTALTVTRCERLPTPLYAGLCK